GAGAGGEEEQRREPTRRAGGPPVCRHGGRGAYDTRHGAVKESRSGATFSLRRRPVRRRRIGGKVRTLGRDQRGGKAGIPALQIWRDGSKGSAFRNDGRAGAFSKACVSALTPNGHRVPVSWWPPSSTAVARIPSDDDRIPH